MLQFQESTSKTVANRDINTDGADTRDPLDRALGDHSPKATSISTAEVKLTTLGYLP